MAGEISHLERVLELLESRGVRWRALRVGDVSIAAVPAVDDEVKRPALSGEAMELDSLRRRARAIFGKTLPDDQLEQMRGAV